MIKDLYRGLFVWYDNYMIPMTPITFWKYFDIVSLGILIVVVSALLALHYKKTGGLLSTISKTVAHSPHTSLIFSVAMTLFFPLYYAFLWFWVGPLIKMPNVFYVLLAISAICEMIFVWMPAKGKTNKAHAIAAGIVGVMMLIISIVILTYSSGLNEASTISIFTFLIVAGCTVVALASRKMYQYAFRIEVTYCVTFLAMMSLIAHS